MSLRLTIVDVEIPFEQELLDFKEGRKISTHEQLFAQPEYILAYESHIFALMREVTA